MGGVDRLQKGRFIAIEGHGGSKRNGHCRVPYDKRAMAKHDTIMPTFYPWSALKCTGAGFMKWTSSFPSPVRAAYIAALRDPDTVHAICDEYRAAATLDLAQDTKDQRAGRRIVCPVLVLWR